jgi:dTDP-4-dehydrorhamnose 3,5-epimerase
MIITPHIFQDERGFLIKPYMKSEFKKYGIDCEFKEDIHSKSAKGVIRGLHFQKRPAAQGKLLRVIKGSIFDVAVDIRKGSPTYGKWASVILSAENKLLFWVPAGFAHGFLTLEESEVIYKETAEYSKENERGIRWDDPDIKIDWPLKGNKPILSEKDSKLPYLRDVDNNFVYGESNC